MPTENEQGAGLFPMQPTGDASLEDKEFESVKHFPPEWHKGIREAIKEGIAEGLRAHCRVPLNNDECRQVGYMFEGIRDLGGGSVHHGMDIMMENHRWMQDRRSEDGKELDENHKWVKRVRTRMDKVSTKVGMIVVTAFVLFLISLFGGGVAGWIESIRAIRPPTP
jgi:hypothetical protein